jgi:hypothetical protein
MGRACSTYGESRGANRMLVGKPEGRRPLWRPRRWLEDNIKTDLRKPLKWDLQVVPKRRFQTTLHRLITQKTYEFSSTAAEVNDLARI